MRKEDEVAVGFLKTICDEVVVEYELCGAVYTDENDYDREVNFCISEEHLNNLFVEFFADKYNNDVEFFLSAYIPEEEGEFMFTEAKKRNWLIEDMEE